MLVTLKKINSILAKTRAYASTLALFDLLAPNFFTNDPRKPH